MPHKFYRVTLCKLIITASFIIKKHLNYNCRCKMLRKLLCELLFKGITNFLDINQEYI